MAPSREVYGRGCYGAGSDRGWRNAIGHPPLPYRPLVSIRPPVADQLIAAARLHVAARHLFTAGAGPSSKDGDRPLQGCEAEGSAFEVRHPLKVPVGRESALMRSHRPRF